MEDTAVADFATLRLIVIISTVFSDFQFAGGKQLDLAPTSVKIVSEGDAITEFENRAVGFAVLMHNAKGDDTKEHRRCRNSKKAPDIAAESFHPCMKN